MNQTIVQCETIQSLRDYLQPLRRAGKRIGFVPTMGYLHAGHASLVSRAKQECDVVVMSIFVNPLQFGPNEDFSRYPRDLQRDKEIAAQAGVSVLFTPSVEEMYPQKLLTTVSVAQVTEPLCGRSRPGHFDGVATVVSKLFHIVGPDAAYFGEKDAQQLAVIEQMVSDLSIPVTIVPCPIVREQDGLAMSSRNVYLSAEERDQALVLSQSLRNAREAIENGETNAAKIRDGIVRMIEAKPLAAIDYVEVMEYPALKTVETLESGQRICIALAVAFGKTRLLDNLIMRIS
ncbi:pantoate--beta-alanine ligase [Brevibacillus fluminis]|uniref:pantoate--beta-alanine ligase n=1 Tax=Brevibacillus fluminis TaxID=511487 RepID=UPI003F88A7C5